MHQKTIVDHHGGFELKVHMLMRKITRSALPIILLSFLSSCDKADRLRAEQAKVDAAKNLIQQETLQYENYMRQLGPNGVGSVAPMERQAAEMIAKAGLEEAKSGEKLTLWTDLEKSATELRTKVDAWKAKYVR